MKSARTNYAMVRTLILKDWCLNRWMMFGSIPAELGSLATVLLGKRVAFLIVELLMVPLLLGMTFYIQSRKTDFL